MKLGVVCIPSVATEEPVTGRINQHFLAPLPVTPCVLKRQINEASASHDI
jgi:hypothetical protein